MGDFNSLRLDFGLSLDGEGNPDATFEKAYGWVEKKLLDKVAELNRELNGD